ncbi:CoA pyrophosphatase [Croceibacterium sp. TMG7-5b_MA50]|uniref:CoA pyrophosphatase n=1 Tax=Croceibacterium sp. TMG7-5b_MA50 TaxID=3121290 RepID=UPI003221D740
MTLFDRLTALFDEGHGLTLPGLASDADLAPAELRPAAVLIAVTERAEPGVLLIHRPRTMRAHAGQVAFPGGKIDAGESATQAALREAEEELGITPAAVRLIGASDRFVTATGYDVTPVLATVPADLPLRPNPAEVSAWFEAPLRFLLDPANHVQRTGEWLGQRRQYLEITWQDHRIWGITAAILSNLSRRLRWQTLFDGEVP